MKKRVLSLMMAISLLCGLVSVPAHAAASIEIGDYIQMGTYYGQPILWRCVDIDENGPLILSDKIICLKPFDAKTSANSTTGSHSRDSEYNIRGSSGSSYWGDSNIRSWLNSTATAGNVEWLCGNPPSEENVLDGYNDYADEAGFLTNFSENERNAMKEVSQKSYLDKADKDVSIMGTEQYMIGSFTIDSLSSSNDKDAYAEYVTDKMFLMDTNQMSAMYENRDVLGDTYDAGKVTAEAVTNSECTWDKYREDLKAGDKWVYWLRTPYSTCNTWCNYKGGAISNNMICYEGEYGVRPAFYLDSESANFVSGAGTESDAYILDASDSPIITVSSATVSAGRTVNVTVDLSGNTGFANLGIQIGYDADKLTLQSVTANEDVEAIYTGAEKLTENPYNLNWNSIENNIYNGRLATLTFKVKEDTEDGEYPVTVTYYKGKDEDYTDGDDVNYDEDFNSIGLRYRNGTITVKDHMPGDINRDGTVNSLDGTILLRYLAGWDVEVDMSALDINGDGRINGHDGTLLLRYLAGWSVTIH